MRVSLHVHQNAIIEDIMNVSIKKILHQLKHDEISDRWNITLNENEILHLIKNIYGITSFDYDEYTNLVKEIGRRYADAEFDIPYTQIDVNITTERENH